MAEAYILLLNSPKEKVAGKVFNVGYENHSVFELANMVKKIISLYI